MNNTQCVRLLRVAMSIALLALAWRLVDGEAVVRLLNALDTRLLFAALAVTVPMQLLSALRWCYTCARLGVPLRFSTAVGDYYLSSLLNSVLPGGMSGDAARVWRQAHADGSGEPGRYRRPLHAVIIERFAGQCALFAVLAAGLVVNHQQLKSMFSLSARQTLTMDMALILALAGAALIALLLIALRALTRRFHLRQHLRALRDDARRALTTWPAFAVQAVLSIAVVSSYLLCFWLAAQSIHVSIDLATTVFAVPLVLTAMTVPLSVGGLGLREATAALLWPLMSLSASDGAASALIYGLVILLGALPGALVLLMQRRICANL